MAPRSRLCKWKVSEIELNETLARINVFPRGGLSLRDLSTTQPSVQMLLAQLPASTCCLSQSPVQLAVGYHNQPCIALLVVVARACLHSCGCPFCLQLLQNDSIKGSVGAALSEAYSDFSELMLEDHGRHMDEDGSVAPNRHLSKPMHVLLEGLGPELASKFGNKLVDSGGAQWDSLLFASSRAQMVQCAGIGPTQVQIGNLCFSFFPEDPENHPSERKRKAN